MSGRSAAAISAPSRSPSCSHPHPPTRPWPCRWQASEHHRCAPHDGQFTHLTGRYPERYFTAGLLLHLLLADEFAGVGRLLELLTTRGILSPGASPGPITQDTVQ